MNLPYKTFSILLGGLLVVACADDEDGEDTTDSAGTVGTTTASTTSDTDDETSSTTTDDSGSETEGAETSDAAGMTDLTYNADIEPIMVASCALDGCHAAGFFRPEMTMGVGYSSLIDVASTQSDLDYVEPGSSEMSYMWHKINDTQVDAGGSGTVMPVAGMLDQGRIDMITEWIDGGAPE